MSLVKFENVSIDYPIFNANGRSLTSRLLEIATGGIVDADPNGKVHVRALSDLSFEISDGDRIGVVGHNGSGKTTLLRAIAGVYPPSRGKYTRSGNVGSLIDIGLGINPEATGLENIFLRGQILGLSKKQLQTKLEDIVNFSQLGDFIHLPVRTYSSGMHLRLAFAVSTAIEPDILIMDEWLSVGDENFKLSAENRLLNLIDKTKCLVIASHSKDLLETICNKVLWLEHGKPVKFGSSSEVLDEYFTSM